MTTNHDLARQIEDLVRQHVDALRISAAAAVARAFAAVPPAISPARVSTPTKPVRTRKHGAPRRAAAELVALGQRFYAIRCQRSGETMTTLAPQVGVAPRVVQVAVGANGRVSLSAETDVLPWLV